MTTPYTFQGALNLPGDTGLVAESIPFNFSSAFGSKIIDGLQLAGSGTFVVNFGTIASPGAKFIAIRVEPDVAAAPVNLRWNGGGSSGQVEVAPGGFLILASPTPVAGITALSLVYTTNVTVSIWGFG
jgi:hypothetical protein